MLEYAILESKPTITLDTEKYGYVEFKDLLVKNFTLDKANFIKPLIVNKEYIARPDLISLATYKNDKFADILCKANGISNPFEMTEDNLIFIPEVECLQDCIVKGLSSNEIATDDSEDFTSQKKDDAKQFLKNTTDVRSSNEMTTEDTNYTIDRSLGLVFY